MKGLIPCGCGQCLPCRINKRRMWANRLMLEKDSHPYAAFATLTYRSEEIQDVSSAGWNADRPVVGNLVLEDVQKFLKRLRREVEPNKIRHFYTGEYGGARQRPHYHLALFGFPPCVHGRTIRNQNGKAICCGPCKKIEEAWGLGRIELGELTKDTASYIAKYVTKKWTTEDTWTEKKLLGRRPEFARMSLKPGIGAIAIKKLLDFGEHTRLEKTVKKCIDAPVVLRRNGSTFPLGRYLRRKWREALGRNQDSPPAVMGQYCEELQRVYEEDRAKAISEGTPRVFTTPRDLYAKKTIPKIKVAEAKFKIYDKGTSL